MNIKQSILLVIIFASLFFSITGVYAQELSTKSALKTSSPSARRLEITALNMDNAKQRATAEIDRRLTSLNKTIERLNKLNRLSSDVKTSLTAQVQVEIDSLTALKAKILADTDVATLKTDIQAIRNSHRIYAFFLPKVHILAAADAMIEAANKAAEIANMLETKITEARNKGQDVTFLETALSDMRTNIDAAKTAGENVQNRVSALALGGFPANKTALQEARTSLRAGKENLKTVRDDARDIWQALRLGSIPLRLRNKTATKNADMTTPTVSASLENQ